MISENQPQSAQNARSGSTAGAVAEKVEWLINHMWPPGIDRARTNDEIAEAIRDATGEQQISRSIIWKIRTGRGENPTLRTLRAIAAFFRVPISYFGDDEEADKIEGQLVKLALWRDGGVDRALLRTLADLSPEGKKAIGEMISSVARMERSRTLRPSPPAPQSSTES